METSILFAKYLGPVLLLTGFSLLLNKQLASDLLADMLKSPALLMIAGILALVLGLTIIIFHNFWVAGWPVIITIYGWLSLAAGVVRITMPGVVKGIALRIGKNDALMKAMYGITALLGIFLTNKGFF